MGFVGLTPILLALLASVGVLYGFFRLLRKQLGELVILKKRLLIPGISTLSLLTLFYFLGWIPPVPLAATHMGIYHHVEKKGDQYFVHHMRPSWKIWHNGDQDFIARPGDKIYFFAKLYSPSGFSDSVFLHWHFHDQKHGWQSTDRIPMAIAGGREEGYRGFSVKQNFQAGEWKVSVETTDGREIGRIYLTVRTSSDTDSKDQSSNFITETH